MLGVRRYAANMMLRILPTTNFYRFKVHVWRWARIDIAANARLVSSVRIWTSGTVSIGDDTFLGHEVMIVGGDAPVWIGAKCGIAPRVTIVTGTHCDGGEDRAAGIGISNSIVIRDGVWIGANATLLGGVEIGHGAIIGAGSLVNRSIPPYAVAAGIPCKIIRYRTKFTSIQHFFVDE